MSSFKLGEEVIHKGRLYKIYEIISQLSIDKGNHTFYTLQDKNLGLIRHIYEEDIKKKPKYTITINDGVQDTILYAEDITQGLHEVSINIDSIMEMNGVPIDLIFGVKLMEGRTNVGKLL